MRVPRAALAQEHLRDDPITLTLDAARLDLSREAGEVYWGAYGVSREK
jgi:hypothetical protein